MSTLPPSRFFPPPELADSYGLLRVGGELAPEWLLDAYAHGIFPWPFNNGRLAWWSPDPRAIFELDRFHVSRRLARTVRSGRFEVTCNRDFSGVIAGCATAAGRRGRTWITPAIRAAYEDLHRLGHAHSIEVWHQGSLAGGTYGVALGAVFCGESMFYRQRDASKVALVHLIRHLRARGYDFMDIQQETPHSTSLGATAIARGEFLARLGAALARPVTFGARLESQEPAA